MSTVSSDFGPDALSVQEPSVSLQNILVQKRNGTAVLIVTVRIETVDPQGQKVFTTVNEEVASGGEWTTKQLPWLTPEMKREILLRYSGSDLSKKPATSLNPADVSTLTRALVSTSAFYLNQFKKVLVRSFSVPHT